MQICSGVDQPIAFQVKVQWKQPHCNSRGKAQKPLGSIRQSYIYDIADIAYSTLGRSLPVDIRVKV